MNKNEIVVDCRSEDGVTIGLIDAITSIARVLAHRDFSPPMVKEALRDLADDENLYLVIDVAKQTCRQLRSLGEGTIEDRWSCNAQDDKYWMSNTARQEH